MKIALFLVFFAALNCSAYAVENTKTICTHGDQQRIIEVIYTGEDEAPCEVRYTKATGTEIPWRAQAEFGYCEDKAKMLIEKHVGWGWSCTEIVTP